MDITPTPPLVLDEHGDIQLFESVEELLQEVEAIDVRNEEYEVFDSRGRKWRLAIPPQERVWFGLERDSGTVVLQNCETEPKHEEELKRRLLHFLDRLGKPVSELSNQPLSHILQRVQRIMEGRE